MSRPAPSAEKDARRSIRALQATNFFLADVQTGLGPFLAAYLAAAGWNAKSVGLAMTVGGALTVALQTPAGALVDRVRSKRAIVVTATLVLALGAALLSLRTDPWAVYSAQVLIGGSGPFLAPTLAAITMGLVGVACFDRQFGRNQSYNSAGNVACAVAIAGLSHLFGNRAIFIAAAVMTLPTIASVLAIRGDQIDYEVARGGVDGEDEQQTAKVMELLGNRTLRLFLLCAFLFHFANAAMLPQLGEMLARGKSESAAPFMAVCVVITQVVIMCSAAGIGRWANAHGRKPLLLLGFGVLPVRGLLYSMIHQRVGLVAVQLLDGVANAIFGVVSVLLIADLTRGSGRFNLAQGCLATCVGLGAALSTTFGGILIDRFGFGASFLALGGVAAIALAVLWVGVRETMVRE